MSLLRELQFLKFIYDQVDDKKEYKETRVKRAPIVIDTTNSNVIDHKIVQQILSPEVYDNISGKLKSVEESDVIKITVPDKVYTITNVFINGFYERYFYGGPSFVLSKGQKIEDVIFGDDANTTMTNYKGWLAEMRELMTIKNFSKSIDNIRIDEAKTKRRLIYNKLFSLFSKLKGIVSTMDFKQDELGLIYESFNIDGGIRIESGMHENKILFLDFLEELKIIYRDEFAKGGSKTLSTHITILNNIKKNLNGVFSNKIYKNKFLSMINKIIVRYKERKTITTKRDADRFIFFNKILSDIYNIDKYTRIQYAILMSNFMNRFSSYIIERRVYWHINIDKGEYNKDGNGKILKKSYNYSIDEFLRYDVIVS